MRGGFQWIFVFLLAALPTLGWFWVKNNLVEAQLEDLTRTIDETLKGCVLAKGSKQRTQHYKG